METDTNGIAIVGMTGRFPGAGNVDEFWANLVAGVESVSFFSDEELAASGLEAAELRKDPGWVAARGIVKEPEWLDAAFFNLGATEAEIIDPQQRLFLEASWEALENAGCDPARFKGYIGVFAGMGSNTYHLNNLHGHPELIARVGELAITLGNEKDYIASRVAYKLDLRGPAVSIHTACSTSLVAVCQACQALLGYQCDLALAGGVSVSFPQKRASYYQEGGIYSPDGHCRPFDAQAGGTSFSDGLGVVVLKRLGEALEDGDEIYAVIKGVGLNNDGAAKVGYTAPSVRGQAEVIALALGQAGIEPDTISYVETHGTATPLGDPIEIAGLTQAFRAGTARKNFCAIGSVKSNIGHLVAAAGVAGLIKTALALKHKRLPASLHFSKPNPKIDFANSPFFVNSKLTEWEPGPTPRRAGVSSFGIGGTNAHVVLEEAPALAPSGPSREWQLLLTSAKTKASLDAGTANLLRHFKANPDLNLADAAFTLREGRQVFQHRQMLVCRGLDDSVAALDSKRVLSGTGAAGNPPVVFMFPGQGAQYVNMGADLYRAEAVFKEEIDRCAEILLPALGLDLRQALYPAAGNEQAAEELLLQTRITQPALFVISYALARLWMSWGVQPRAMIGHSVGEYVAGCLAGVLSLPDALKIVAGRAKLVQAQPAGSMLAVRLPEAEVAPYMTGELAMAALNSPKMCVVSGPTPAIDKLEAYLTEKRVPAKRLSTSHAFHSAMMDPVVAPLTELLKTVKYNEPAIPYVSNVTGRWVTAAQATDPGYWAGHVRQPVRFADGLAELARQSGSILLEVGPGQSLSAFARQHPAWPPGHLVLSSLPVSREHEQAAMLTALGRLWIAGVAVDWKGFHQLEKRRRIALPTYAFERKRFWVEPAKSAAPAETPVAPPVLEPSASAVAQPAMTRTDRILAAVTALFKEISGAAATDLSPTARFAEIGLDSLLLAQASQMLQKKFGVPIAFRRLLDDLSTLNDLAHFLDQAMPSDLAAAEPAAPAAAPATQESFPLTESQKELWLASQAGDDASRAFTQLFAIHLRGPANAEAMRGILQQLVDRHDALRTTFASDGSSQTISPCWKIELPSRDLSGSSEGERELAEAMKREDQTAFDLAKGPLFRARLFKLSGERSVLSLAAHHIILDGWSMGVLLREFGQLYAARENGTAAPLAPAMQYREFAQWQNSAEHRAATEASEAYWVQQFSKLPNDLELPADRPRPPVKTYCVGEREALLDASIYQALKQAAAAQDCTLFVLLLASIQVWLFRLTGEEDLVIGVPAAGHLAVAGRPGGSFLAGHCVNTLPVRARCDGAARFADHLKSVKRVMLDAYEHQNLTLGSLVRKLNMRTDPSRAPLVPMVLNLSRASRGLRLPEARVVFPPKSFAFFDLNVDAHDSGKDLRIVCRYNASLFDGARIERMLNEYQTLLKAAAENPAQRLVDLPLLTEDERRQILVEWNRTEAAYPADRCVHEWVEEQARRTPEAEAVAFQESRLTYRELHERSNRLAHCLRKLGVGPDVPVGICVERSLDMAAGVLGILKAGGAYVPLDSEYPKERLAFMLEDARVPVLLTQQGLSAKIPAGRARVICLDGDRGLFESESAETPQNTARPENLAYIIYTSGSTGQPKGVAMVHRAVANLICWQCARPGFSGGLRTLQFASLGFDVSFQELFSTWCSGGTLVLAPEDIRRDFDRLLRFLAEQQVQRMFLPFVALEHLAETAVEQGAIPSCLRELITAGEQLRMTAGIRAFFEKLPRCTLENQYGPTEAHVVSAFTLTGPPAQWPTLPPIGRPIWNTSLYVLDGEGQPTPVGLPGELLIGGTALARGYYQRPELTAQKFIADPFAGKPGARLYRTGDLARYLADGNIEFLGRMDHQVKIRGFRIELGEIESALGGLPGVREAVVVAREDVPGQKRLVAYLTARGGDLPKVSELRGLLKAKLPEYMVPAAFVTLDALPLSPNGKVDRKALPKPDFEPAADQFAPPNTPTEMALAKIWSEVLGIKRIGVRDDFFELGGHSLLATKMISRIRNDYHIELTLVSLFENPSLAGLAGVIDQRCMDEVQTDELSRLLLEIENTAE